MKHTRSSLRLESLESREVPTTALLPHAGATAGGVSFFASPQAVQRFYEEPSTILGKPLLTNGGAGQTVAIVDAYADPQTTSGQSAVAAELHTFDATFHLPDPKHLRVVNQGSTPNDSQQAGEWFVEEALDVEWVHAMAPAANILVVNAADSSGISLLNAETYATSHAFIVTNSWGAPSFAGDQFLGFFFQPANPLARVAVLASAGDTPTVNWPSDLNQSRPPIVVSVGGTTAAHDYAGSYLSETTWAQSGLRGNVAFVADPQSGVPVFVVTSASGKYPHGGMGYVGGTSLSSPAEAAIVAIADQERKPHGLPTLSSNDYIVALRKMPAADKHAGGLPGVGSLRIRQAVTFLSTFKPQPLVPQVSQGPARPPASVQPFIHEVHLHAH